MSIRALPAELQLTAKTDLNEVPSRIEDDLKHIHEWLSKQPHLTVRTEDQWLLSFLRGCKFNLEKTKQKLDTYYSIRSLVPELFAVRDPFLPEMQELLKLGACVPLPKTLNPTEQPVVLFHFSKIDPKKIHILDVMKIVFMSLDILINENDNLIIAGHQVVEDLKNISKLHLLQMTPSHSKKIFMCFQEAYPIRPQIMHFMNAPSFFETLFNLIKPFMSKKLNSRIKMCNENNMEEFYRDVPRSALPVEYGGEAGSFNDMAAGWKKKVESYQEWFLEDAKFRSDESKRRGKPKTTADLFGVEGSFRKLNID